MSSAQAVTRWKRSISSASPPAVGKTSTGVPNVPQRTTSTSCSTRSEYQLDDSLDVTLSRPRVGAATSGRRLGAPALDAPPEQLGELVDLVGGEQRGDLLLDRVVGDVGREELPHDLVEVGQMGGAERLELVALEPLLRDRRVGGELLRIRRVGVGDLEVRRPVEAHPHRTLGRGAEDRPAQVGGDEPREVVVQRGHLRVGAGVGEVDRVPRIALAQRLAGVELPPEERVDRQCRVDDRAALIVGHVAVVHRVAIVQRGGRVVAHEPGLRPEADAADEQVVRLDRSLQVQQVGATRVVGAVEVLAGLHSADPGPAAAVERLGEQRIADGPADLVEVEELGVAGERDRQVR